MSFWIKKYEHGEVGRWLHSKKVGDEIEIRAPLQTWLWKDDNISGGSGIAPFFQLFHEIISRGVSSRTRFTLLHSSRSPSELPPSKILQRLSSFASENPERFKFRVFVDTLDSEEKQKMQLNCADRNQWSLQYRVLMVEISLKDPFSNKWNDTLVLQCVASLGD
ncbi:ferredoxin reductase-like protein [Lentinula edodes]|uniref:Ferredoxin reductase-like protein n=1 Tax=Lentinula edodes TaxID=5353 RepID=A0A1Q3DX49_LENED|nr:ferredoxin reductase-like protein [Lentinula edodes]